MVVVSHKVGSQIRKHSVVCCMVIATYLTITFYQMFIKKLFTMHFCTSHSAHCRVADKKQWHGKQNLTLLLYLSQTRMFYFFE